MPIPSPTPLPIFLELTRPSPDEAADDDAEGELGETELAVGSALMTGPRVVRELIGVSVTVAGPAVL